MKTLIVPTQPSYRIFIDKNRLRYSVSVIKKHLLDDSIFIITNTTIASLYQCKLDLLFKRSLRTSWITIPDSERFKSLTICEKIFVQLTKLGANRSSCLLALGGGVVGDITGFVASTYMRGIRYFQMPTTLLAQVDAAVGGKTGVNLITGKNLIGTFYQPSAVFVHTDFLKTLSDREYSCGLAEVVKYALIRDIKLWRLLKKNTSKILARDQALLTEIITRCCRIKADIVSKDEREHGLRTILNLGHTLGHAIERLGRFKRFKHGEAVAMGLVFAAELSYRLGVSKRNLALEIGGLLRTFGLLTRQPKFSNKQYRGALQTDKKSNRFVFLRKIGTPVTKKVTMGQLLSQ